MFDVDQCMFRSQRFLMISNSDDNADDVEVEVEPSSFVKKDSHLISTHTLRSPEISCYFINSLSLVMTFQDRLISPLKFVIFLDFNCSVYSSPSLSQDI